MVVTGGSSKETRKRFSTNEDSVAASIYPCLEKANQLKLIHGPQPPPHTGWIRVSQTIQLRLRTMGGRGQVKPVTLTTIWSMLPALSRYLPCLYFAWEGPLCVHPYMSIVPGTAIPSCIRWWPVPLYLGMTEENICTPIPFLIWWLCPHTLDRQRMGRYCQCLGARRMCTSGPPTPAPAPTPPRPPPWATLCPPALFVEPLGAPPLTTVFFESPESPPPPPSVYSSFLLIPVEGAAPSPPPSYERGSAGPWEGSGIWHHFPGIPILNLWAPTPPHPDRSD